MDMTLVSRPPLPAWLRLAIIATIVWPFLWPLRKKLSGDLRAFLVVPVSLNIAATSLGVLHVIRVLSFTGRSPHATAAGLAEALLPLAIGTGVAAALGLPVIFKGDQQRSRGGSAVHLVLVVHVLSFGAILMFAVAVQRKAVFSTTIHHVGVTILAVAVALLLLALFLTFRPHSPQDARSVWYVAFVFANVLAMGVAITEINAMRAIALGAVELLVGADFARSTAGWYH